MIDTFEGIKIPQDIKDYLGDHPEDQHLSIMGDIVYREKPVSMEQFILDENYLNQGRAIFPNLVPLLSYVDDPNIRKAFFLVGRGAGKSTSSAILLARGIYKLWCYRDARAFLGAIPGKEIVVINVSVSETQAKEGVFSILKAIISNSPWFRDKFEIQQRKIFFDGNFVAICGHSRSTSWLGFDIFTGVLDEANFLLDRKDKSNADVLYTALQKSGVTRFPHHYKMVAISSAKEDGDFMTRKIKPIKDRRYSRVVVPGLEGLLKFRRRKDKESA